MIPEWPGRAAERAAADRALPNKIKLPSEVRTARIVVGLRSESVWASKAASGSVRLRNQHSGAAEIKSIQFGNQPTAQSAGRVIRIVQVEERVRHVDPENGHISQVPGRNR